MRSFSKFLAVAVGLAAQRAWHLLLNRPFWANPHGEAEARRRDEQPEDHRQRQGEGSPNTSSATDPRGQRRRAILQVSRQRRELDRADVPLPREPVPPGSVLGQRNGFKYKDAKGDQGPAVKSVSIAEPSGSFSIKVKSREERRGERRPAESRQRGCLALKLGQPRAPAIVTRSTSA
jgi:hypothetical protein